MISVRAPMALANCSAKRLTPPVPSSATVDPTVMAAAFSALQAVVAAMGNVAASAKDRCAGMAASDAAGTAANSAADPGMVTPRMRRTAAAVRPPAAQSGR